VSEVCRKFSLFVEKLLLPDPPVFFNLRCHCTTDACFDRLNDLRLIRNRRIIIVENAKSGCLTFRHQCSKELLASADIWHTKWDHFRQFLDNFCASSNSGGTADSNGTCSILVYKTNKVHLILQCKYYVRL